MKLSRKSILVGVLLTASIAANLFLAYQVVDSGISLTYESASFDAEHNRAETLLALVDSKRSHITPSELKALAQKKGWSSFLKKTHSPTTQLLVVNGVGFRIEGNRVLAVGVYE